MSITVLQSGILDTIQDLGRYGHAHIGINAGGCMDTVAARAANFLVGNNEYEAVIEMHFPAAVLHFQKATMIAITGADHSPHINDHLIPVNTPVIVPAGSTLRSQQQRSGARSYLAVKGGLQLNKWLNSYSTHLKAKAGGCMGRAFQKNDVIHYTSNIIHPTSDIIVLPWHADLQMIYGEHTSIRFVTGHEYNDLNECDASILEGNEFVITSRSDRMGFRLSGTPLRNSTTKELITSAVTRGTVQLLPDGQMIILMADHQTTGGYPRIAHVISADISRLAQMNAGTHFRFERISIEAAEQLYIQQRTHLQQLQNACNFRLNEWISKHDH